MKVKEESEKVGSKLNIQKTKIMTSGPITSWQIDGETVETVADFIFGGSKITADGDCSCAIKRRLLLGRRGMTNLDNVLKSRHHFDDKGPYSQGYGFSSSYVWSESWTINEKLRKELQPRYTVKKFGCKADGESVALDNGTVFRSKALARYVGDSTELFMFQ